MKLKSQKVEVLIKINWSLCIVTCSAAEDVKHESYPNLSKNTIKIKCSSVHFCLFISAVVWLSPLLFEKLSGLNCQSSHWWCNVDGKKNSCWLVRMVLVE